MTEKGVTFTALWSESRDAWEHYGMNSTSDFMLLDSLGNRLTEPEPYDEQLVTRLLEDLA